jgi:hypothetical protein
MSVGKQEAGNRFLVTAERRTAVAAAASGKANHSIGRAIVKPSVVDCIALSQPRYQKPSNAIDTGQFA